MKKILTASLLALAVAGSSFAAPVSFDFKDPKGVNAISFHLDSLLEPISGTANGISGTVMFDPAKPAATSGTIVVAAPSLTVTNNTMREHLLSDGWIDATGHPEIVFVIDGLKMAKTSGNTTTGNAVGKFTLKGVTQEVSIPVKITHLAGAFGKRINKPDMGGDLLVVRGDFSILRSDYGIKPGQMEDKVANEVELSIAVVGGAPGA
ncbi:YceI family protein [Synoicihabitans lomoniglobus]|uniref:YceI family protein n=1 Tax=Synoicihabitans lomoniglobus TaxID=2909285 RepID=A0AAF0CQ15_9BACT|nr:YceI family protein [Opitutaceae bacterium LMO-M01]WED65946.1 YceI family protein [Opitutaceae bacterium LMO-M01]